jgi:predicted DNA-binding transcriptional regulator YafY
VVFQWTAWYVFGYCLSRRDFRLFKLARLWDLAVLDETFIPREIPPERSDFGAYFTDGERLVALFDPSARYQLIEAYGLHCYQETEEGLLKLEVGFTNRDYIKGWLLGFGEKARVLEPRDLAEEIRRTTRKMCEVYLKQDT